MWNEDGRIAVVFNGEIYNHRKLREELAGRGHCFRSDHSDTEVLVHGYEEWGSDLPLRLNGMFAFAAYDKRKGELFLARDRFGKKPLYYAQADGRFSFASELRGLARHSHFELEIDRRALKKFFAYGFIPAPNTLYQNCQKLPGGCHITVDARTGRAEVRRYWRYAIEPEEDGAGEEALAEELRHLLSRAVERRLMSDVPLGFFLSGGIDSSAILHFASEHLPRGQIESFSIGFEEPSYDESSHARDVARLIGTSHHEKILSIDKARDILPEVLSRLDEPLGDASILPTFLLSEFSRRHVTVALSGDGGDELFAGYDPFQALRPASVYERCVPRGVHRMLRRLAGALPLSSSNMSLDFKLRRSLAGLSYPRRFWNPVWLGALDHEEIADLFGEPTDPEDLYSEAADVWDHSTSDNLIDKTLEFYANLYLQDDILMKTDRASMMVSLEVRSPFLDNDVVDFARRLPNRFKYRGGVRKYILKKALKDLLPDRILHRKKKGFGIPLVQWLREFPLDARMDSVPQLDPEWVATRWREHQAGKADHRQFLWCWLGLHYHMTSLESGVTP
jgi:asparagine synthase (glutamine-hydrolysing)